MRRDQDCGTVVYHRREVAAKHFADPLVGSKECAIRCALYCGGFGSWHDACKAGDDDTGNSKACKPSWCGHALSSLG